MIPPTILFVCTGNIFRSVAAELCLRKALRRSGFGGQTRVSSAGIDASPRLLHHFVQAALEAHGIESRGHRPRKLTKKIFSSSDLIIAMGSDHQDYIAKIYGVKVPLFRELCFGEIAGVLDVHEAVPEFLSRMPLVEQHVIDTINLIERGTRLLADQWHQLGALCEPTAVPGAKRRGRRPRGPGLPAESSAR
jgi:protein-tyrosine phosphatase